MNDVPLVGGKTASLGEMVRALSPLGIRVPNGFAVTVQGYWDHLQAHKLKTGLADLLGELKDGNDADLTSKAYWARQLILSSPLPPALEQELLEAYRELSRESEEAFTDVAIRSSATAEDLPQASFAGQQETYLNVRGEAQVLENCRKCFASLFTERAISYRNELGIDHMKVALSVCVQKMVRSDIGASGVMFSLDTETGFPDVVLINSSYGLGENIVQGTVNPDEFLVFKPTLRDGLKPILRRQVGSKEFRLIYDQGGEKLTRNVPVPEKERAKLSLNDEEVLTLARWAVEVERHYGALRGTPTPMDMEWAKDGNNGQLFLVQARPETVQSRRSPTSITSYRMKEKGSLLTKGHSVGGKIGQGRVRVIHDASEHSLLQKGEVLVTEKTDPDWEPVMKRASAIVTNSGGRTCHAAIVSRELGIPAVVGTLDATRVLADAQEVTVSCAEGDEGHVYAGLLPFEVTETALAEVPRTKTRIMINVADPESALSLWALPQDGVGLAREEFIVSHHVKVHPMALAHFSELADQGVKNAIAELTKGYEDKTEYFVDKLAEGVGLIAAAFYPKDVIVRLSDFKTNEYANLLGGRQFEPTEENPMLGFRGASRYSHPAYRDGFALECRAFRKARELMGLTNIKLMVPFCRTPQEGKEVLAEMERNGLRRGENGLEVYVMCELPSNVLLAREFAEIFDGFSIGSNDLTQLVLGVDRGSASVAGLFDERNPAVLAMIARVIRMAKAMGKKVGICGQAPSDYPEFAAFLVRKGIDSISLNPDAAIRVRSLVAETERQMAASHPSAPNLSNRSPSVELRKQSPEGRKS